MPNMIVVYIVSRNSEIGSTPVKIGQILEHNGEIFAKIIGKGVSFSATKGAIKRAEYNGTLEVLSWRER